MVSKFLDPKDDVTFKWVFGTKQLKGILIYLRNAKLESSSEDGKIQQFFFLKTSQNLEIVDVLCTKG